MPGPLRVAVVDADRGFVLMLANRLQAIGGEARIFSTPPPTAELLPMRVKAVVFDAEHVGSRAFDFLGRLVAELPTAAVVVTAQNATLTQRLRGLRSGADDWVKKPCHAEEVVARIEAVLRRRDPLLGVDVRPLTAGGVEIRPDRFQVFANGISADLTSREFDVLRLLAEADGRVISRDEIYANVWGYTMAHGDRSVDVFVRKVRAKLRVVSPDWDYIHTHFGIGYRFEPEARDASTTTPEDEAQEAREQTRRRLSPESRQQLFGELRSPRRLGSSLDLQADDVRGTTGTSWTMSPPPASGAASRACSRA